MNITKFNTSHHKIMQNSTKNTLKNDIKQHKRHNPI